MYLLFFLCVCVCVGGGCMILILFSPHRAIGFKDPCFNTATFRSPFFHHLKKCQKADSEASDAAAQLNAKDKELQKFCPTDSQPLDTLKPLRNFGQTTGRKF